MNQRSNILDTTEGLLIEGNLTVQGNVDISTTTAYKINTDTIIQYDTLGSSIINSSLQNVGTLSSLNVSGNLGVGTTSPSENLHIYGGNIFLETNGDTSAVWRFYQQGNNIYGSFGVENSGGTGELLLNLEVNTTVTGGTRSNAYRGAIFRIDTRATGGDKLFQWWRQEATTNNYVKMMTLDYDAELHLSGNFTTNSIKYTPDTASATPSAGLVYYDSGTNKLRVYNGSSWVDLH